MIQTDVTLTVFFWIREYYEMSYSDDCGCKNTDKSDMIYADALYTKALSYSINIIHLSLSPTGPEALGKTISTSSK